MSYGLNYVMESYDSPYGMIIDCYKPLPPLTQEQLKARDEAFQAQLQKMSDLFSSSDTSDLRAIRSQLSPSSQRVLNQVKNGSQAVNAAEWTGLCRELKNFGLISGSDFDWVKSDAQGFIYDYFDKDGNYVHLPTPPESILHSYARAGLLPPGSRRPATEWPGNPLLYLERWIDSTQSWLNDLVKIKNDNGTRKYPDLSPVRDQVDSYKRVYALVEKLSTL